MNDNFSKPETITSSITAIIYVICVLAWGFVFLNVSQRPPKQLNKPTPEPHIQRVPPAVPTPIDRGISHGTK